MSQVQVATDITAVIAQIISDHSDYPLVVEEENRETVDLARQKDPYLKVEIKFLAAAQIDLGNQQTWKEQWGQIWITAMCKPGQGTARVKALIDFVTPYFDARQIGIVMCGAVASASGKEVNGMWRQPALVTFRYHRLT